MRAWQNLIGGAWRPARGGQSLEMLCPSDGLPFARIARGGPGDIDGAVTAARAAFAGAWGRMPAVGRGRLLTRLGLAVAADHDGLAALEAEDTGKPLKQARADIAALARYLEFYGGAADKLHGATIPFLEGYTALTLREPHGVTGHILPWNYPTQVLGRSVGAALAAGNACVVKPSEEACLSVLRIAELALEAGLPAGALNVVTGLGEEAGAALAAHPGVDFVSFTGSPEVGKLVQRAAAGHHAGCTLELGGKSPQLVFADADLDAALPAVVNAIIQNAGQTCSAGSRLLVELSIWDKLIGRVANRFSELRVGTHAMDLDLGALINGAQKRRVEANLERAAADGIPVLARGRLEPGLPAGGHYVAPMLLGPVPPSHPIACEEMFGPVLAATPFADEAEAIRLANGTPYGLVAGIWTREGARQLRLAKAVRAGQVFVNAYGAGGGIELPFGGVGRSGHGREKGFEGLLGFTALKTVVLRHG
jgi:aldehyde dehydrogenase (NAD+)